MNKSHSASYSEKIQNEFQSDRDISKDIVPRACKIAMSFITKDMKKFLDVGCGPGYFGKMVKDIQEAEIVGIEFTKKNAAGAQKRLDKVYEADAEHFTLPYENQYFDCISYFDVLEHMIDPWQVLKNHRPFLRNAGTVIASIPNIRNLETLSDVVNGGRWTYNKEGGILDATHLRFFTWITIQEMFAEAGYKITDTAATMIAYYPQWLDAGKPSLIDSGIMTIKLNENNMADLFVAQFVIKAKKIIND